MELTVGEVVAAMHRRYPPETAASWDASGLIVGDPKAPVARVLFAVDPHPSVIGQAVADGADLLITHHPLLFGGVTSVAGNTANGRAVAQLVRGGVALLAVHTNADVAWPGVADALADAVGVTVDEQVSLTDDGVGRIGSLDNAVTLAEFAETVRAALPRTAHPVRIAGERSTVVRRVALCGGSGDSLLAAVAQTDADVYLTSDLKHHAADNFRNETGKALIDVPHWASEWPWLPQAARLLAADLAPTSLDIEVSTLVTDPWSSDN